jgi:hypothetical protein
MKGILGWFEAQPLQITVLLMTALSACLALLWVPIRSRGVKWALTLLSPFFIAWQVYWLPVRMGKSPSEYAAWVGVFMIAWGIPGAIAASLVVVFGSALRSRKRKVGPSGA